MEQAPGSGPESHVRKVAAVPTQDMACPRCIRPLGSPWSASNRVYEQSVPACRTCNRGGAEEGYYPAGVWVGGWWEGAIPVPTLPPSQYRYIGIARAQPATNPRFCVHPGTPGSLQDPSAHPGSSHSNMALWQQ